MDSDIFMSRYCACGSLGVAGKNIPLTSEKERTYIFDEDRDHWNRTMGHITASRIYMVGLLHFSLYIYIKGDIYGMNNYVLIWGDWLSCDPLRGSHDSQSPHIRTHLCPILRQL